jgi:alkyl hydroperoxide reductase subunit AhpC
MSAQVQKAAPNFEAQAVVGTEFKKIKLSDYKGKYVVLFFYPLDFTFVCPTEILSFSDRFEEFKKRGADILAVSVDSHYTHLAWVNTPRKEGGLGNINYPIVSDLNKQISRDYNVLNEDLGIALRGLFLIDREGVVRHMIVNDLSLGRSIDEAIRVLDALLYVEKHGGEGCPANWKPGEDTIAADPEGSKKYFKKVNA